MIARGAPMIPELALNWDDKHTRKLYSEVDVLLYISHTTGRCALIRPITN
jgi:hypothetical protein